MTLPDPSAEALASFEPIMAEMESAAVAYRASAIKLQKAFAASGGGDPALAVFTSPKAAGHLGAISRLLTLEEGRQRGTVAQILGALPPQAKRAFGRALGAGMVRAASSCPCGTCFTCTIRNDARSRNEDETAAIEMALQHEAEQGASPLVAPDGQPAHQAKRIILAS